MLRDDGPLERERMHRRGSDAVREIETEANLGARGDRKVDRIAQGRCPAGMVTEEWPPKVTVRIEPAWSLAKSIGVATVAEPITRGVEPYSFVRRIQIRELQWISLHAPLPSARLSSTTARLGPGPQPSHWPSRSQSTTCAAPWPIAAQAGKNKRGHFAVAFSCVEFLHSAVLHFANRWEIGSPRFFRLRR